MNWRNNFVIFLEKFKEFKEFKVPIAIGINEFKEF